MGNVCLETEEQRNRRSTPVRTCQLSDSRSCSTICIATVMLQCTSGCALGNKLAVLASGRLRPPNSSAPTALSVSLLPASLSISVFLGAGKRLFLSVSSGGAHHRSALPWTWGLPAPSAKPYQTGTRPLQNRTAGIAKPTKPVIPEEKIKSL